MSLCYDQYNCTIWLTVLSFDHINCKYHFISIFTPSWITLSHDAVWTCFSMHTYVYVRMHVRPYSLYENFRARCRACVCTCVCPLWSHQIEMAEIEAPFLAELFMHHNKQCLNTTFPPDCQRSWSSFLTSYIRKFNVFAITPKRSHLETSSLASIYMSTMDIMPSKVKQIFLWTWPSFSKSND